MPLFGQARGQDAQVVYQLSRINQTLEQIAHGQKSIMGTLHTIFQQGNRLMGVSQEIKDAMARIDVATTAVATRIQALVDQIGSGLTPEEAAGIRDALTAEAAKLEAIGANPENPVPEPTPSTDEGGTPG